MARRTIIQHAKARGMLPSLLSNLITALILATCGISARIRARDAGEHVVLVDCVDTSSGVVSSQMAYYPGQPDGSPKDVAVVQTPAGQARIWPNANTTGLFTDTGVSFNASLGPLVGDSEYAGSGENGYGSFSCWQKYYADLYRYDGKKCSQVYDCDHRPAPNITTRAGENAGGISATVKIGVIIGAVCFVTLASCMSIILFLRRREQRRIGGSRRTGYCGIFGGKRAELHGSPAQSSAPTPVYEMDGEWRGAEIHAEDLKEVEGDSMGELDSSVLRGELEAVPTWERDVKRRDFSEDQIVTMVHLDAMARKLREESDRNKAQS